MSVIRADSPGVTGNMNNKGFTLLEVLIGTAVLSLMVFMIWSISSTTLDSEDRITKRDEVLQMARISFRKLSDDISQAFIAANQDLLGKTKDAANVQTAFIGDESGGFGKIDFTSFSHWRMFRDAKESETAEVGYYVVQDQEVPEKKILMRRESTLLDNDVTEGGKAHPLAEGVANFKLEYYDGRQNEWKREWNSTTADNKDKLPKAVKIFLSFTDPGESEEPLEFSTIVYINLWQYPVEF